jgi:paired amphipathic helix protein Sin3a
VIKKVYDNERGLEVIEALHNNPAIAVPIVLKRLKQKDEEWKRSQVRKHIDLA